MTVLFKASALLIVLLLLAACAATTGYGKAPQPVGPDAYVFTVYFNSFASPADAEKKAAQYASEFMPQHGYSSYEIRDRQCDTSHGRCDFRIAFRK